MSGGGVDATRSLVLYRIGYMFCRSARRDGMPRVYFRGSVEAAWRPLSLSIAYAIGQLHSVRGTGAWLLPCSVIVARKLDHFATNRVFAPLPAVLLAASVDNAPIDRTAHTALVYG